MTADPDSVTRRFFDPAGRVALIYVLCAGAWIFLSDRWVVPSVGDRTLLTRISIVKGWGFVVVTALVLYHLVRNATRRLELSHQSLQASEERFRLAMQGAHDGLWDWNLQTDVVSYSPRCCTMLGHTPGEIERTPGAWSRMIHPEDRAATQFDLRRFLDGREERFEAEYRIVHRDGHFVHVLSRAFLVRDHSGRPVRMVGTHSDISERKRHEAEILRLSRLYAVLSQVNQAVVRAAQPDDLLRVVCAGIVERGGFELGWIGRIESTGDLTVAAASGATTPGLEHEIRTLIDDRADGAPPVILALREDRSVVSNDLETDPEPGPWRALAVRHGCRASAAFPIHSGRRMWGALVLYSAEVGCFGEGEIGVLREAAADIGFAIHALEIEANRRAIEGALRSSEERFRTLVEAAPEAIFVANRGRFAYLNPAAVALFGATCPRQLLDLPVIERFRPADRAPIAERYRAVAKESRTAPAREEQILRLDGSTLTVEGMAVPFCYSDEAGALVFLRDISRRKAAEQQLEESAELLRGLNHRLLEVQEAERRGLARELHDEIGQSLTAIKLDLQCLAPDSTSRDERLAEGIELVDRTLEQVRSMALDLRPSMLDDLGLIPALRWYVERHARRTGISGRFEAEAEPLQTTSTVATACFRAVQEALTNVARHARATRFSVELVKHHGGLQLVVCDDGAGFDPAAALSRAAGGESLGLLGMRERVELAGGRVEFASEPGAGTEVRIEFPAD